MDPVSAPEADEDLQTALERRYARAGVPAPIATWAPRVVGLAIAAAVASAVSSFLPWAYASLNDRGAPILLVTAHGVDAAYTGRWVVALALLTVIAGAVLLAEPVNRLLTAAIALLGAGIMVAGFAGWGKNAAMIHKLGNIRTGTIDEVHPVAHGGDRYGLWLTITAGAVVALAALAWLAVVSAYERRHPRVYDGSQLY